MSKKFISNSIRKIAIILGNVLIFFRPKRAHQLSENRITLLHRNINSLTLQDKLMRTALIKKLEKIDDHNTIAKLNRNFWSNNKATELFLETEDLFETHFLPNCTFIFEILKKDLSEPLKEFNTLVEIGTGNGFVLNYLKEKFPHINRFVGIDLSKQQVEINNEKFKKNPKLEFVASDASDWVKENGYGKTIFVTRDVLEYFLEPNLQEFFKEINRLGEIIFIAIEPNGSNHKFDINPNSQLYGNEPSFSHNYRKLFENAGFNLWHFSQKPWAGGGSTQTFVGAKNF